MPVTTDPRVDAYIARAAPFALPILRHLRATVHGACPDVTETIKWGHPFFLHRRTILGHMAAFKQHCGFGLWGGRGVAKSAPEGMGQFGRIATLGDLPARAELKRAIAAAMALIDAAPTRPAQPPSTPAQRTARSLPPLPEALAEALQRSEAAREVFDGFAPTHQRDYIEWIADAKRPATPRHPRRAGDRMAGARARPGTGNTGRAEPRSARCPAPFCFLDDALVAQLVQVRAQGTHRHREELRLDVGIDPGEQGVGVDRPERMQPRRAPWPRAAAGARRSPPWPASVAPSGTRGRAPATPGRGRPGRAASPGRRPCRHRAG